MRKVGKKTGISSSGLQDGWTDGWRNGADEVEGWWSKRDESSTGNW